MKSGHIVPSECIATHVVVDSLIMTMMINEYGTLFSLSDMYLPHDKSWVSVVKLPRRNPQWSVPLTHVLNIRFKCYLFLAEKGIGFK